MHERVVIVDEGRAAVRAAFGFVFVPSESPTAYFSGQQRSGAKLKRGRSRVRRVHATPTRASGFSKPNLSARQPLMGFIHRCMAELSPLEQNWIHFRYRQPCRRRQEAEHAFLRAYTESFTALHLDGCRPGTRAIVREMVAFRMRQCAGEIPMSANFESINGAMSRQLWAKGYRKHWISICGDLVQIDEGALFEIGIQLEYADHQRGLTKVDNLTT